jgi:hypothetical protein
MFCLRFETISARNSGIVFEFSVQNRASRTATIISQVYELWLPRDIRGSHSEFLSELSLDLLPVARGQATYEPQEQRVLSLVWHYLPRQLQRLEDVRQGIQPNFEIRNLLGVNSQWLNPDRTPHAAPVFLEETAFDGQTNSYPVRFKLDQAMWTQVLNEIGFRQIILHELPLPSFPPGFERAEQILKDAWDHHRAGREDGALQSCYKAFECLGFNLCGDKVERAAVLSRLMDGQEESKQRTIADLWDALNRFFHLGRHERTQAVNLFHRDGELAVVSATILLSYLAGSLTDGQIDEI